MSKYCRMQNVLIVYELSLICCCIYVCGEDVELETSTRGTLLVVLGSISLIEVLALFGIPAYGLHVRHIAVGI